MTIQDLQAQIVEEMSALDGPIETYRYLVAQGKTLNTRDGRLRREENLIRGCQSRVWIEIEARRGRLGLSADSDAMIVRGIAALLLRVLDDRSPQTVATVDLYFIEQTGLSTHLSPHRANGLASMVDHIRACARRYTRDA